MFAKVQGFWTSKNQKLIHNQTCNESKILLAVLDHDTLHNFTTDLVQNTQHTHTVPCMQC